MTARRKAGTPPPTVRVAVYARKSTTYGLEQEFNSLDAQQEAVDAYVKSQREQGWIVLPERYHDGGFSGGSTDRPAFQRLMADVETGKIDIVAVYRLDRLSRSQRDLIQTLDVFERHGVQFVSITERMDTTTLMGKFNTSILAAVAELERGTVSERTRDKIAATRRKGMWCGGTPVLGYRLEDGRLVHDGERAEQVREMFRIYLDRGSLIATAEELNRRGWTTRTGRPWTNTALRAVLTNPILAGKMKYKDEVHEGVHDAIIDAATWGAVQHRLKTNRQTGGADQRNKWGALLRGMLDCATCGGGMIHHYTSRGDRRFRYYVCSTAMKRGAAACPGSRVNAGDAEAFVVDQIRRVARDPALLTATMEAARTDHEARKPALVAEIRKLETDRRRLDEDRRGILAAIPDAGPAVATLTTHLTEIDDHLGRLASRLTEVRADLRTPDAIDEDALRAALADFDGLWGTLVVRERVRLLGLLIERVTYDGATGDVTIEFRPGGPQAAARRKSA